MGTAANALLVVGSGAAGRTSAAHAAHATRTGVGAARAALRVCGESGGGILKALALEPGGGTCNALPTCVALDACGTCAALTACAASTAFGAPTAFALDVSAALEGMRGEGGLRAGGRLRLRRRRVRGGVVDGEGDIEWEIPFRGLVAADAYDPILSGRLRAPRLGTSQQIGRPCVLLA